MTKMRGATTLLCLGFALALGGCSLQKQEAIAHTFQETFETACLESLPNLSDASRLLSKVSRLTPEKAKTLMGGVPSSGWLVKTEHKSFILTQTEDKTVCELRAKGLDTAVLRELFEESVASAPSPYLTVGLPIAREQGAKKTLSAAWAAPTQNQKVTLTLTTEHTAVLGDQAIASVSLTPR